MSKIHSIKLPNGDVYQLKDIGALQLTGGNVTGPVNFGNSVFIQDLNTTSLLVSGSASVVNTLYSSKIQTEKLYAPISNGGTIYGIGSIDEALLSNGTSIYWGQPNVVKLKQYPFEQSSSLGEFVDTNALIYMAADGSNTYTDKPTGSSNTDAFGILSFKAAAGYYSQILVSSSENSGIFWRCGTNLSGGWKKILDSNNYNEYTVTKNGIGASGTWGININGNATTATSAVQDQSGNNIKANYASSLAVSGTTFTLNNKNGTAISTIAITSANIPNLNTSKITDGTLSVSRGGTGVSSFTANQLIMSSSTTTGALITRAISTVITDSSSIPTEGAVKTYVDTITEPITQGVYVTLDTEQTIIGRKIFQNLDSTNFKPSTGTKSCNISYNQNLSALVFSFTN